jgi:hypothetical protein
MTLQEILNSFAGVALAVLGWFAREVWSAVQELKRDLGVLREELPKTYVTRNDYKDDIRELKEMLARIFDRLDDKADK